MTYRTAAWAIGLRLDGHRTLLGVVNRESAKAAERQGLTIGLWATRRAARSDLAAQRARGGDWARAQYWNRARVVRVRVTITEEEEPDRPMRTERVFAVGTRVRLTDHARHMFTFPRDGKGVVVGNAIGGCLMVEYHGRQGKTRCSWTQDHWTEDRDA